MPTKFNPFAEWLGLNPKNNNPHHFQLLGVSTKLTDESEVRKAVEAGLKRNLILLAKVAPGQHDKLVEQVKQRLLLAQKTLLDSNRRQAYLDQLKIQIKAQPSGKSSSALSLSNPTAQAPSVPKNQNAPPTSVGKSGSPVRAGRKAVFTPPTIGDAAATTTTPLPGNQATAPPAVTGDRPIPMAIPLSPPAQPMAPGTSGPKTDGVAVNADGVPIDTVKIRKKGLRRRKKSKLGLFVGIFMLLAALVGGFLIYQNFHVLMNLAGIDPEVVPMAPGIVKDKEDPPANDVDQPSIPAANQNDLTGNAHAETGLSSLPSLDLDALPELNIEAVMSDPITERVTGRDAESQKEFDAMNRARLKAMGFEDPSTSENTVEEKNATSEKPSVDDDPENPPAGEAVSLDEMQLARLRRHLERARRSLYRRDKSVALNSIDRADRIIAEVRTDNSTRFVAEQTPIVAIAAETKEIYELIEGFWAQVVASCQTIPGGQEIVASGQPIGFIEADPEKITVRHAGSNVTYEYYFCPPSLAVSLAKQGAIPDIPTWNKQLAAFYALNQTDGVDYQRQIDGLLKLSEDAGHDCDGIRHFASFEFGDIGKPVDKIEMPNRKAFNEVIKEFRAENDYTDVAKLAQGKAGMLAELLMQIDSPNFEQHVVLLEEARQLAIRSGDAATAEDAIIELDNFANIDVPNLMCDTFLQISKNELTAGQRRALMEQAIPFLKSGIAQSAKLKLLQQLKNSLTDIATAYGMTDAARRISQLKK